ncbi:CAP domain-containing protein [Georgenia sp. H159]|uniref:CAP domain-containing protein n=1 Tax=Georgenia sp. H159 TaxID=3076115 RepID=UPI002D79BB6C|nr:CAP domain-containing protein [Georgenia sp. H159]
MTEPGPRRHRTSVISAPVQRLLGARARVAPNLQRRYRAGLAGGLAFVLVAGVSAAAVVDDPTAARADLSALGLEVEHPASPGIAVPETEELAFGELEVDVELPKDDVWHLREVQVAARNAERQALAEREAAAAAAAAAEREQQAQAQAQAQAQPTRQQRRAQAEQAPAQESAPQPQVASAGSGGERGSIASMVNGLRAQNGLGALGRNGTLDSVAQNWAEWMAANQTLQHNPNYRSQIGGGWSRSGENIVRNTGAQSWSSGDITSWMFNWWANSAPHRANMLNTAYSHVGVGYAMGSGGPYAVLVFGG